MTEQDLAARIADHAAAGRPVFIRGSGSKEGFGQLVAADAVIDMTPFDGILDYEPSELYITVKAGTPLPRILEALAPNRQILAFEPPPCAALYGHALPQTAGGIVACNMAGPRRVRAGAARDHFLGFTAINGQGAVWRAGAKVVKNVSGYDMCKLQAGAFGTLSVLTETTFRLLPAPETSGSIAVIGLADAEAVQLMAQALNTPHEVSAAAHLPAQASARLYPGGLAGGGGAVTLLRVEGHAPSVAYRLDALAHLHAARVRLTDVESEAAWRAIATVQPLLEAAESLLWRICPTPSSAAVILAALMKAFAGSGGFYDWGGGLIWFELPATSAGGAVDDAGAARLRGILAPHGGHATLIRAPEDVRRRVPVFQPVDSAMASLAKRVKHAFDPQGILNPGRMTAPVI